MDVRKTTDFLGKIMPHPVNSSCKWRRHYLSYQKSLSRDHMEKPNLGMIYDFQSHCLLPTQRFSKEGKCSLEHSGKGWEMILWDWIKLGDLFSFKRIEKNVVFWKKYKVTYNNIPFKGLNGGEINYEIKMNMFHFSSKFHLARINTMRKKAEKWTLACIFFLDSREYKFKSWRQRHPSCQLSGEGKKNMLYTSFLFKPSNCNSFPLKYKNENKLHSNAQWKLRRMWFVFVIYL